MYKVVWSFLFYFLIPRFNLATYLLHAEKIATKKSSCSKCTRACLLHKYYLKGKQKILQVVSAKQQVKATPLAIPNMRCLV
jgi:hypothetical protein